MSASIVIVGGCAPASSATIRIALTFGTLLDRAQYPAPISLAKRPELAHQGRLAKPAATLDVAPTAVFDIIAEPRLDADHNPIEPRISAMCESHVLDLGHAEELHPVAPAPAFEAVEPPLPFGEELRRNELAEACAIVCVPRGLDLAEEVRGSRTHDIGS